MPIITEWGDGSRTRFLLPVHNKQATATVAGSAATIASQTDESITFASAPAAGAQVVITYTPVGGAGVLRQVATHCRFPNVLGGIKQAFAMSPHFAATALNRFRVGFANYTGRDEVVSTGSLIVMTALEYPIGSDKLQFFTYGGAPTGIIAPGGDILSDPIDALTTIPAGALFRLWHWHGSATGVPYAYNGPQPMTQDASNALFKYSGTIAGNINNLVLMSTAAQRAGVANTGATTNLQLVPVCIVAETTTRAAMLIGDSRTSGQNISAPYLFDYVSDSQLVAGIGERLFGRYFPAWINMSATADGANNFLTGTGSRRMAYMKYVTDVVDLYGTNDTGQAQATLLAFPAQLKALPLVVGKKFWGITIPPNTTSTDYFATLAGQTVGANEANRLAKNAAARVTPHPTYDGVLDVAAAVEDSGTGKWKVSPQGRSITGTMSVGSNILTAATGTFTAADGGQDVVVVGAGAAGAILTGMLVYTDATHATIVDRLTGAVVNCATAVTGAVTVVGARRYTGDGVHETQYACLQTETLYGATASAMLA